MKVSRIVITGRMRMNDTVPVEQILTGFEDPTTEEVQVILAGSGGMYNADSCLALAELVEDQRRKTGKRVTAHLLTSVGIMDFFVWLKCGIDGRSMRSTARVWLNIPKWSRFSSRCHETDPCEIEENLDEMAVLEALNEYLPISEFEGKQVNILVLDEFGLLDESLLCLMEKKGYEWPLRKSSRGKI
jgi:hypothetical protein